MNAPAKPPQLTVQYYVDRLTPIYERMRVDVFALGELLIEAKAQLPHGEFSVMIYYSLPFTPAQAQMFMRIARNPRLANHRTSDVLPSSPRTLDELTKISPDRYDSAVASGKIHRLMTVEDAKALQGPPAREPIPIQASDGDELYEPCKGHTDILARLKGYRLLSGISQLEMDERANLQSGYTGKIEVQIKPLTMETMIDEINALALKLYILPDDAEVRVLV